jgi:hypothetical protein
MTIGAGSAIAAAALALGALGIANFSPQGEVKAAEPVQMQRRISGQFNNAGLSEVLKWLGGQGVSFVVDSATISGERKLTMNIVNQPLGDVIDAIAGAFDGKWERHGEVYTLKGPQRLALVPDGLPNVKQFKIDPDTFKGLDQLKKFAPEIKVEIEKMLEGLDKGEIKQFRMAPGDLGTKLREFKLDPQDIEGFDGPILRLGARDIPKLMNSLTADQWARHEKQGYLTPNDLTPDQRKLAGRFPSGENWTVSYSINGKNLTLKSK